MALVHLVPICLPSQPLLLDQVAAQVGRAFAATVVVRPHRFDPELAFDSSRGQYHSTLLLEHLLGESTGSEERILGIAGVDLFIPILTYVFGEAQLDGRAAVVSTYRLDNSLYGLPVDHRLLLDRLVKESVHELGHTVGLIHCHHATCVMRSSTYVEDIDLKDAQFCSRCNQKAGRQI
ncbi:MAG TPA: archaemetzincin family Zn-dependent metalloprotease [Polyangia bacterium]